MLSQEDFYDRAKDFALFKDVEGKHFTFEEYKTLIKDNQTDKDGNLVYLYSTDKDEQFSFIEAAKAKGYSVLMLDGELDVPCVSMFEQKFEKSRFTRVDSDIIERLIVKEDMKSAELTDDEKDCITEVFRSQIPTLDKADFNVDIQALGESSQPVVITRNEYMRRMKEMSRYQAGMNFYAQMPDSYSMVLNSEHEIVKSVLADATKKTSDELKPILSEIKGQEARIAALRQSQDKKKADEITQEEKDDMSNTQKALEEQRGKKKTIYSEYAKGNDIIHQLIDLALLQNGMLKGKALDDFVRRSIELIK